MSIVLKRAWLFALILVPCLAQAPTQASASQAPAPAPQSTPPPAFSSEVKEVLVPVTVTDEKGRFVSNLDAKDFRIFDEGKEQKIDYFSRERSQPVVVGFLLDMSNSMRIHWKTYQDAVIELIQGLLPGDKRYNGYLVTYGNEAELAVNTTNDPEMMVQKVMNFKPGGGAALFDAIYKSCTTRNMIQGEPYEPRRVIVIIGDGHDTASKHSLAEVLELAQRNLVTIYAVSTAAFGFKSDGEDTLTKLTQETGGRVEVPLNNLYQDVSGYLSTPSDEGNYAYKVGTGGYAAEISSGIIRAVGHIAGEVTTQYIIRYIPDTSGKKVSNRDFRRIKVTVPSLPTVTIRNRIGYYPNPVGAEAASPR
ncbi:MAG TPA: VWA domain-containing protein [Bryobacteraceae bacterium]|jgi:VWFA-related protein